MPSYRTVCQILMSSQLTFQFRLLYFLQNLTHWFPLRNTPWFFLYSRSLQHICIQSALFILHLFICDLVVNATLHPSKCLPSSVIISLFQESTTPCSSPQPPLTCSAYRPAHAAPSAQPLSLLIPSTHCQMSLSAISPPSSPSQSPASCHIFLLHRKTFLENNGTLHYPS